MRCSWNILTSSSGLLAILLPDSTPSRIPSVRLSDFVLESRNPRSPLRLLGFLCYYFHGSVSIRLCSGRPELSDIPGGDVTMAHRDFPALWTPDAGCVEACGDVLEWSCGSLQTRDRESTLTPRTDWLGPGVGSFGCSRPSPPQLACRVASCRVLSEGDKRNSKGRPSPRLSNLRVASSFRQYQHSARRVGRAMIGRLLCPGASVSDSAEENLDSRSFVTWCRQDLARSADRGSRQDE